MPRKPKLLQDLTDCLEDQKAQAIIIKDVSQYSTLCRYMVIATARSSRHALALSDHLAQLVKKQQKISYHCEGDATGEWWLIDCDSVIVHLFLQEARERFALEKLWE